MVYLDNKFKSPKHKVGTGFVLVETMARWIYKLIKLRGFLGQMGKFCPNFAKCLVNPRMP